LWRWLTWAEIALLLAAGLAVGGGLFRTVADLKRHSGEAILIAALGFTGVAWALAMHALGRRRAVIVGWLLLWIAVKLTYSEVYWPERNLREQASSLGRAIARRVPGPVLYSFSYRHQEVLVYAGKDIRRCTEPADLPPGGPHHVLMTRGQVADLSAHLRVREIRSFWNAEGREIVLARVWRES
jgi:hypothetical protein